MEKILFAQAKMAGYPELMLGRKTLLQPARQGSAIFAQGVTKHGPFLLKNIQRSFNPFLAISLSGMGTGT